MISKKQSKFIKSLKIKKYRDIENAFIVEGKKNVFELIDSDFEIIFIVCAKGFAEVNPQIFNKGIEIIVSAENELNQLGTFKVNHECLAVAKKKTFHIKQFISSGITFLLDDIGDPGNLGTIIRTLDWFGYRSVICSSRTADFYNPKVINATMGSFTRISPYYTDLASFIRQSSEVAYGADMGGQNLSDIKVPKSALIVMGSESSGISQNVKGLLKAMISIKGFGKAESLNVGVATGILCHHFRNY